MSYWTIETHQTETGAWVGVVRKRPGGKNVEFMTGCHCSAMFAFLDCANWVKAREQLTEGSARVFEQSNGFGDPPQAKVA